MKLKAVRTFLKGDDVEQYQNDVINRFLEDLQTVINGSLGFDNFGGQKLTGLTIKAGAELEISHNLGIIPSGRLILNQNNVNSLVTNGPTAWTKQYIYLKNQGASDTIIDVFILR